MSVIPEAAVAALKTFNPYAKAFFVHRDGRFGTRYSDATYQWVRYQSPFGFIDAGMSKSTEDAQRANELQEN